ncbi:hypothetical protein BGW80DRAFT_291071 [Lactifluus volemus]|nr:hypothetical protein BGW80DRAFT_291071 [Lactifluus volemus]
MKKVEKGMKKKTSVGDYSHVYLQPIRLVWGDIRAGRCGIPVFVGAGRRGIKGGDVDKAQGIDLPPPPAPLRKPRERASGTRRYSMVIQYSIPPWYGTMMISFCLLPRNCYPISLYCYSIIPWRVACDFSHTVHPARSSSLRSASRAGPSLERTLGEVQGFRQSFHSPTSICDSLQYIKNSLGHPDASPTLAPGR